MQLFVLVLLGFVLAEGEVEPKKKTRKRERNGSGAGESRKERKMEKKMAKTLKEFKKQNKGLVRRQKELEGTVAEMRTIINRLDANFRKWQDDYMPLDSRELIEKLNQLENFDRTSQINERELSSFQTQERRIKRIDTLEEDNKRLADRNENLINEIKRINKASGNTIEERRQVFMNGKPASVAPIIYTNLNIAEENSVIVTGGTLNGTTLSNVLSITFKNQSNTAAAYTSSSSSEEDLALAGMVALMRRQKVSVRKLEDLPAPLRFHCSTAYKGQIFVLGGYADEGFPRRQNYGLINGREWQALPEMIYARAKFGCTAWQDRLWVIGGYDRQTLDTTENFGIFQSVWQEGPKLIQKRHSAPIVTTSKGLFIIGGRDTHVLQSVELMTANKHRMVERPPLPLEMDGLSATTMGDDIYIVGTTKHDHVSKVLLFRGGEWRTKGTLKTPRHSPIAMSINNELWFIGGCCGVLPGIERLDVETGMTITENVSELEERYNFAALYYN